MSHIEPSGCVRERTAAAPGRPDRRRRSRGWLTRLGLRQRCLVDIDVCSELAAGERNRPSGVVDDGRHREVAERSPTPERKRSGEPFGCAVRGTARKRVFAFVEQALEATDVDSVVRDP